MTVAERKRRQRKKERVEAKEITRAAAKQRAQQRRGDLDVIYRTLTREFTEAVWWEARKSLWNELFYRPPLFDAKGEADECARQIAEFIAQGEGVTIDDVRAAIDRRFGENGRKELPDHDCARD